ncbi:MAG: hypothetical protein WA432_02130 [Candidatus Babeliaceae bacterium]
MLYMRLRTVFIIFLSLFLMWSIHAKFWEENSVQAIENFLHLYTRPFTVLESCHKNPYSLLLAGKHQGTFVIRTEKKVQGLLKDIQKAHLANVIMVNPLQWNPTIAAELARCEYFDLVIIRDISQDSINFGAWLRALSELTDYVFIEIKEAEVCQLKNYASFFEQMQLVIHYKEKSLYLLKTYKKGLDVARWNLCWQLPHLPIHAPRYRVISTFNEKKLCKNGAITPWLAGINLMTFIMLRGIYPTNELIKDQLVRLRTINHNDLVLGNFIVMGSKRVIPIDFKDPRHHIDTQKCLNAAIAYFSNKDRFKNPKESLNEYQRSLSRKR